jgi:hypothetical protein
VYSLFPIRLHEDYAATRSEVVQDEIPGLHAIFAFGQTNQNPALNGEAGLFL